MNIHYTVTQGVNAYFHLTYDQMERLCKRLLNASYDTIIVSHAGRVVERYDDF